MSLFDHPAVQVRFVQMARHECACVAVMAGRLAANLTPRDLHSQGSGGIESTPISGAVGPLALLPGLGRVDSFQAYPLARDVERIAVNYLGAAGQVFCTRGPAKEDKSNGQEPSQGSIARRHCRLRASVHRVSGVVLASERLSRLPRSA